MNQVKSSQVLTVVKVKLIVKSKLIYGTEGIYNENIALKYVVVIPISDTLAQLASHGVSSHRTVSSNLSANEFVSPSPHPGRGSGWHTGYITNLKCQRLGLDLRSSPYDFRRAIGEKTFAVDKRSQSHIISFFSHSGENE